MYVPKCISVMTASSRDLSVGAQLVLWLLLLLVALLLAGALTNMAGHWGWQGTYVPPVAAGVSVAVVTIGERGWRKGIIRLGWGDVAMGVGMGSVTALGVLVGYLL